MNKMNEYYDKNEIDKLKLWKECQNELGFHTARKFTPQYQQVKELFVQRLNGLNGSGPLNDKNISPHLKLWKEAAENVNLSNISVKKGSEEYGMVMDEYKRLLKKIKK